MILQEWRVQKRVWGAVFMREIQIRWGRRNLGFAWLFAEPLVFAFPVLVMWSLLRSPFEHGIPLMPFVWSGYLPLLMFRHVTGRSIYTVRQNAAMLYHRFVTPLDLVMARCGLEMIGGVAATAFSFAVLYVLGVLDWPRNFPLFLAGNLYNAWWALSVALIVAAGSERTETVEHIWQPFSYMYVPICGFMFLAEWLPSSVRGLALKLPSVQCYEMIRGGLLGNVIRTYYDIGYLTFVLAVLTLIGLWMMHGIRRHLEMDW